MMRHESENELPTNIDMDAWTEQLDALVAGKSIPSSNDDELLQLATRLSTALAPLIEMRKAAETKMQVPGGMAVFRAGKLARRASFPALKTAIPRPYLLLIAAVACCVLLLIGSSTLAALRDGLAQIWGTSTSLDQLQGISVAALEHPRNGIKPLPLLPTGLPASTQGTSYGVITDASNPNILITFVADYHIDGQDVLLYEQPSAVAFPTTATGTQTVRIGSIKGQLFQDSAGTHALQWYQHGISCQITSRLPTTRLIALAATFQQIKSWQFII